MEFTEKEVIWILVAIVLFEFVIFFPNINSLNLALILVPIIIILVNVITKKIASGFYNIKIEHKIWEFQRYGWRKEDQFKKPFPIGLIFSLIISILFNGFLKVLTFLQFEEENIIEKRLLRRKGSYRKTEINESDPAFTAAWGFFSLLILAIFATLIKYPELARYSIYYGFWNLLPISKLDGTKIFFGSILTWFIMAILFIIGIVLVIV